jgi:ATP-dependent Clp protease ATP-binding subunit ClpC
MNGYNFDEGVRKVLAMARDQARRLDHEDVATEHVLLPLIRAEDEVAVAVLRNLRIDLAVVCRSIDERSREEERTLETVDGRTRSPVHVGR